MVQIAVDTLGHLLGLVVTPASEQERSQVQQLAAQVQQITKERLEKMGKVQSPLINRWGDYDYRNHLPHFLLRFGAYH